MFVDEAEDLLGPGAAGVKVCQSQLWAVVAVVDIKSGGWGNEIPL
jgi:hypothetical protein